MVNPSANDPIFQPLTINGVTFKNRIVRSSLGGRIDYYDGSISEARIVWDRRFAAGGVAAIISSNAGIRTDGIAVIARQFSGVPGSPGIFFQNIFTNLPLT
jgi:2,4-dienoyl-CoA reductase-like NADH-dependent reductase (Old Yellow Enzyme family)